MNDLSNDPRTLSLDGTRGALKQAKAISTNLLSTLGATEKASWVALSANLIPQLALLSDQRLLVFSVTSTASPPRFVVRPYRFELGRSRFMGQEVMLYDGRDNKIGLVLQPDDLSRVRAHAGDERPPTSPPEASSPPWSGSTTSPNAAAGGVPGAPGAWNWGRAVLTPVDAEYLAASHMAYLGFQGVQVTQLSGDGGLDVVALGAAGQVKYHAAPTGRPDIQQLRGAADSFPSRLFYATGYTPQGIIAAQQLGVALFQFTSEGLTVAINDAARTIGAQVHTPPAPRGLFGNLTFEGRQNRAILWAQQIQAAAESPISDRKRKGARQLQQRQVALGLLTQGLAQLQDSENPLYKNGRRARTLGQAEKALKSAAQLLGIRLR